MRMKRLSNSQVAGVYRRNVGNVAVATVNDGMIPTAFDHIVGVDPAACEARHRSVGRPTPPWLTVNTFLIESDERLLLVDAGYADNSPGAGLLLPNLAALGVKPIDIDTVLVPHLHADHDAGLIDRTGAAVFPHAELVVHENELTFWRDESNVALLSEGQKVDFVLATRVLEGLR
jgi:glyoxylase-like metal-dependent hydrolase (beta-lactamase superfamily II)